MSGLAGVALTAFAITLLLLRYVVLPQIENYRGDVEQKLSAAIQLPVSIGSIAGRMEGLRPRLELRNLTIKDASGRPALSFDNVVGIVSWSSVLYGEPRFHLLEVAAPVLAVRRDAAGKFFIAGLAVKDDDAGPSLSSWVLDQHAVVIRDARLTWTDELRQAPPLTFDHLNLRLEHAVIGHRFGLTGQPPAALAAAIDLRGTFSGDSLKTIRQWHGELYGSVDYADLAGWHPWVDYPVELPHGRGAAHVWLDFADLRPTAVTADLSLADVQMRLAPTLAMLSLRKLDGRIAVRQTDSGIDLSTQGLSLATIDGIHLAPTDLHLERDADGGDFTANAVDLGALAALAAHLPLPENFRRQLAAYAPQGSLQQFHIRWQGQDWPLAQYSIKGGFKGLGFSSVGKQPAFSGVSGSVDGDEHAGTLQLAGRDATLTLPAVFHEPMVFDALDARVRWEKVGSHTQLALSQIQFRNADAEGTASGTYLTNDGMGNIDLDARLSRAEGPAVWRYMPLQAGPDVGPFLHAGLTQGKVSEATLKLKGDLGKFPFADRSGTFRIHGVFHDAALRYASNWPRIDGVAGELDFDGPTMTITAREASILGVRTAPAKAVIPDLASIDEQVLVEGKAAGATTDFLRFIEASPVGEQIDHFTEDMKASGNGELDLKLVLPLRRLPQSTVTGSYRFDGNQLILDPDLPPLADVRGHLDFSAESLSAKGLTGTILGLPLKLDLKTLNDGSVLAEASGDASAAQLRKQFAYAGLKSLSGSAHWSGTVKARKKTAEVRIASDLVGLSSSLPEPFNKSAREAMPLLFERKSADPGQLGNRIKDRVERKNTELSVGRALNAQLVYRDEAGRSSFERGLISVGDVAMRLPESGLTLAVFQPRINLDAWRSLLSEGGDKPAGAASAKAGANTTTKVAQAAVPAATQGGSSALTPNRIDLHTTELQAMGRNFHDVKISATRPLKTWTADISSRELAAKLDWLDGDAGNSVNGGNGSGSAKLSGRITRFMLPAASVEDVVSTEALQTLPNLDLTLDHLTLNGHDYGELHLTALNEGSNWNSSFSVKNDDGALEGQGRWRISSAAQAATASTTQLDFKLHAKSIERFLNRIGYPNTVRRGNADLGGRLSWSGAPHEFGIASMNGQLTLEAHDGQFNKLEPGVGRLLGVLSLQSIPRRITLDFRDIFSEGFAFDTIKGQVAVSNGVLDTQNMEIRGPAAKVQMAGNVDLVKETQDLKVRVQPTFSESVATGALFVNPAVGATAWAFNKLFGSPLDNVFAYDFAVTGAWVDPKVEKVAAVRGLGAAAKTESGK